MVPAFDNQLASSLFLWLDHEILDRGQAFFNHGSYFYPVSNRFQGYYTYACPFKPLVADFSITGANVMTGVYVNGNLIGIGQSGLVDINYTEGQLYFNHPITGQVSGNYSVKEVNVQLTDQPEEQLLFETKYFLRPKTQQSITGLPPISETFPVLFLKNDGGQNKPLAFGGMDNTQVSFRGLILMDSQFNSDAINSILRDTNNRNLPLINANEMPFNSLGGFKNSIPYNYTGLTSQKALNNQYALITHAFVSKFQVRNSLLTEIKDLNANIYFSIVDLDIEMARYPRGRT